MSSGMALHFAIHERQTYRAKILIDEKANIEAKDIDGKTPLIVASEMGRTYIANVDR